MGISAEPHALAGAGGDVSPTAGSPTGGQPPPLPQLTPKDEQTHRLLAAAFAANDFLAACVADREQVRQLADACTLARFPAGACVIAEGEPGSVLYVVEVRVGYGAVVDSY